MAHDLDAVRAVLKNVVPALHARANVVAMAVG